jgi:hypothetical protein
LNRIADGLQLIRMITTLWLRISGRRGRRRAVVLGFVGVSTLNLDILASAGDVQF